MTRPRTPSLDFDGEYEAEMFSARTGYTYRLPWSAIAWQRRRNDISEATVTVAPIDGPAYDKRTDILRALEPWGCELRISRNASIVWSGPIVGFGRGETGPGSEAPVTIRARDRMAVTKRRLIAADRSYTSQSLGGTILPQIVSDAFAESASRYTFTVSADGWGISGSRAYIARSGETLWSCIEELSERGLTWSMVGPTFVGDAATFTAASARIGLFTDESFVSLPGVDIDGLEMANLYDVAAGESTDIGFLAIGFYSSVDPVLGRLETFEQRSDLTNTTDADAYALEQFNRFRFPLATIAQATISTAAPVAFADLIPGVNVAISFEESVMLGAADLYGHTLHGLDQVDVAVDASDQGLAERVSLTFGPPTEGI